jgi:hypothetical protein
MARRTGMLGFLATLVVLILAIGAPMALAHHKDGHEQGGGDDATTSNDIPDDNDDNAHPSGKDRETVNGSGDDAQGNSGSNPDNDGHGPERNSCEGSGVDECVDKAGGDGGVDTDDQDGNNGCGNDDDFEDDNEGWCGKPPKTENEVGGKTVEKPNKPCDADDTMPGVQQCTSNPPVVGGEVIVDVPCVRDSSMGSGDEVCGLPTDVETKPAAPEDTVLGELITRGSDVAAAAVAPAAVEAAAVEAEAATLPFTGGSIVQFLVTGLSLVTLGGISVLARKR